MDWDGMGFAGWRVRRLMGWDFFWRFGEILCPVVRCNVHLGFFEEYYGTEFTRVGEQGRRRRGSLPTGGTYLLQDSSQHRVPAGAQARGMGNARSVR